MTEIMMLYRLVRKLFCCYPRGRIQGACDCPLCGHQHTYRQCADFNKSKSITSMVSYHDFKPHREEEAGFMAAGIFLINKEGQALMIRETRGGQEKYNFIGGKRECRYDCFGLPRLESSFETAATEFEEEIGEELPSSRWESVYWFPESKYLLFVVRGAVATDRAGEWFSRSDFIEGILRSRFHNYIVTQLHTVLEI